MIILKHNCLAQMCDMYLSHAPLSVFLNAAIGGDRHGNLCCTANWPVIRVQQTQMCTFMNRFTQTFKVWMRQQIFIPAREYVLPSPS